ncbi:conodipine-P1 [Hydra vulgaris]|uniref:Conodipine-P1 n=1 Tax=Hydra vulgaris TaxID=6087 RepID=A0ABM4BM65_HYDVU
MMFLILISAFILHAESSDVDTKCLVNEHLNGCSTPFHLPLPYKGMFTPACMTHDICYRCGVKFGWSQVECDLRFKTGMTNICKKKIATPRSKRDVSLWEKMIEKYEKVKNGWEKTTSNKTKTEEAKRLLLATKEIFKMIGKWFTLKNEMEKCLQAVDIYYYSVATYGIYAYRTTAKSYCDQKCAKDLGLNLHE